MDIHIHGREGADVMDATEHGLQTIADALVKTGVVAWVGTTVTAPIDDIRLALSQVREFYQNHKRRAHCYLEAF